MINEAFCPVIAQISIDAKTVPEFLSKSVEICHHRIWGNLSMTLIVDPSTESKYKKEVEETIGALHYGTIAVNVWSAFGFALVTPLWGAFPGNESRDIQSGKGFVHNVFMLDYPQKNVLRCQFRLPFDLKLLHFPAFKGSNNAINALVDFEYNDSFLKLFPFLWKMLKA